MKSGIHGVPFVIASLAVAISGCGMNGSGGSSNATVVGPPRGTVIVVGGGVVGPEIVSRFIEAAGGPEALIVDVPTAGGAAKYAADWRGANFLRAAGAKNVVILHTTDTTVSNSDAFAGVLARAGGVWFEGGRQWHLADSYLGTKTERAFHDVLARGGVIGGSSAGASIIGSYLLRGAPEGNEAVMSPGHEVGMSFLRGTGIDQHVVARERLPDLADSLMPRHPELLGISEDEGTAWVVHGDVADIVGRNKAFVYGGHDATDPGKPFLTLYPGDRYNLATRRVLHRASEDSPVSRSMIAELVRGGGQVTVQVSEAGKVLVDEAFGVPDQVRFMPRTTLPEFPLGGLNEPINAIAEQLLRPTDGKRGSSTYAAAINRRVFVPIGAHQTTVDANGEFKSNVDELYRLELVMQAPKILGDSGSGVTPDVTRGFTADTYRGVRRLSVYGDANGHRNAWVRFPDQRLSIIVLSDRPDLDARNVADQIAAKFTLP